MARIFLSVIIFIGVSFGASAQSNIYKLHSLFIYNFTKHIQWAQESGAFTIGVYGSTTAYNVLKENLGDKRVWGQPLNLIEINDASEASKCQLIYAPKSNKNKIISLLESMDMKNKLFVTEDDDLIEFGAQISFFLKANRLNFKIDKSKLESNGLKVSSALLSLGTPVES